MKDLLKKTEIKGRVTFDFDGVGDVKVGANVIVMNDKQFINDELVEMVVAMHIESAASCFLAKAGERTRE